MVVDPGLIEYVTVPTFPVVTAEIEPLLPLKQLQFVVDETVVRISFIEMVLLLNEEQPDDVIAPNTVYTVVYAGADGKVIDEVFSFVDQR